MQENFNTRAIHGHKVDKTLCDPLVTPIYQTSTFVFENAAHGAKLFAGEQDGFFYTRIDNPNSRELAMCIADLENAEAGVCFSSGMGAVTAVIWSFLSSGAQLIADKTLYGCTFELFEQGLPQYGVQVDFTDLADPASLEKLLSPKTKMIYLETPANPNLKLIDIAAVAKAAHDYNPEILIVVDNTFATPYLQRPIDLGADIVLHSTTKYLNGHGDVIAGAVVGRQELIADVQTKGLRYFNGAVLGPFEAWLIRRGIKTLPLRMDRHCSSAMKVAEFLENHPKIKVVYFPGLKSHPQHDLATRQMSQYGAMMAFELNATKEESEKFINSCKLCRLAVSLGDCETLIQHPASMTHSTYGPEELADAGISESLIRLSVGLEAPEDVIADLEQALNQI
ncbi:MAG: aminotransferase class I/II-fold pyridoxal phosphate-dependent enzyme [Eubacteriales bacterium]|nr:aminotransferase class I/II-fold pyridoxal phosphate-dependent enzyme [Eubacteriales bacterium]